MVIVPAAAHLSGYLHLPTHHTSHCPPPPSQTLPTQIQLPMSLYQRRPAPDPSHPIVAVHGVDAIPLGLHTLTKQPVGAGFRKERGSQLTRHPLPLVGSTPQPAPEPVENRKNQPRLGQLVPLPGSPESPGNNLGGEKYPPSTFKQKQRPLSRRISHPKVLT
jgi:hypothetical protein